MKKVLFVDIGGVCCDNPWTVLSEKLDARFGISSSSTLPVFVRESVDLDIGRTDFRQFYERTIIEMGIPLALEEFIGMHDDSLSLKKDVCALLYEVRKRNRIRLVALSNMPEHTWSVLERRYSMADMFDDSVLSYSYSVIKPDPAIFDIALRKEDIGAEEALFVDDRKENVEAAGRIGIQSILFTSPGQLRKDLSMNGLVPFP